MKIIFLGTPNFAEVILRGLADSPYRPDLVITEPDRPVGRDLLISPPVVKVAAIKLGIPVEQPATGAELLTILQREQADLGIVAAYGRILKPAMLQSTRLGFLNVHGSLLPKYRGASPVQAALLAGDTESGVTIMLIDAGLDTGPILATEPVTISPNETTPSLMTKIADAGDRLLLKVIPDFTNGALQVQPQPPTGVSVTSLITKGDGRLTGTESPSRILNMLRAYTPWPGVWFKIDEQRILLLEAELSAGQLVPKRLQLAGKQPVDWQTFCRDRARLAERILAFLNPNLDVR